ncbi:hypothetical protein ABEB36_006444 [Hypothenemus hampei]|uniref:HAT C-terminal dimerisation domain-containing protein n=1 Tax=Hypothenemus hampei TaxID=57062 RepID=A0ABD1EQJ4_HYPHA
MDKKEFLKCWWNSTYNMIKSFNHWMWDILEYWKKYERTDMDLYELAKVALAVPATQVSVERSFNSVITENSN